MSLMNFVIEWLVLFLRISKSRVQVSARKSDILTQIFVVFLSPFKKVQEQCLKLGLDRFLSYTYLSFSS
jgi:hypothetical protein